MKNFKLIFAIISLLVIMSCSDDPTSIRNDLISVIDSTGYSGCFVMYNLNKDQTTFINLNRARRQFSPASTFKIPNSLIAIETQAVSSVNDTIRYNGIEKPIADWNRDHDLLSAFKYSVVWYYQDIANRIGDSTMKFWLDTLVDYGTMIRPGVINQFWLDGSLVISAEQQVRFLTKLYNDELPFKKSTMDTVKHMMRYEGNPEYTLYGKTGLGQKQNIGWFVGWIEKSNNTYIFATNIETKDSLDSKFMDTRISLTKKLLNKLQVIN
ncbi:MAG: class D beta-lactamase [Candidatus Kapabacteria bacterium]|nr:class D beta-lactamase [Candidatus Kapabacteria bacterium]